MVPPLRLAFAGTPPFALPALNAVIGAGHELRGVFTQPDRPAGRGRALRESVVKRRAEELGLAVYQPGSFKSADALAMLRSLEVDALIVVAYGQILPADALAAPRLGCFNIHASLLPRWRGAAPIQRAILAADRVTGVTIMRMAAGLDTGPILASRSALITDRDTAGDLQDRLAGIGAQLLCETLDALAADRARETPQPESGVTIAAKIEKSEALLDWGEDAAAIARKVRAFNPWPIAETHWNGTQLRIWEAESREHPDAAAAPGTVTGAGRLGVDVACGRGVLRITRLQLAGRKPLAAEQFLRARALGDARFGVS